MGYLMQNSHILISFRCKSDPSWLASARICMYSSYLPFNSQRGIFCDQLRRPGGILAFWPCRPTARSVLSSKPSNPPERSRRP